MRLLVIGQNNNGFAEAARIALEKGARVAHAEDIREAIANLRSGKGADLIMIDAKLDIAFFVSSLNAERITVPIVACGFNNNPKEAVQAIKAGAKEYIPLPPDVKLISAIFSAISDDSRPNFCKSSSMQKIMNMVEKVAPSDANILITGPSGAGKEVISRIIYQNSRRATKPFIRVNCAAIPENLLESELFGHEKGAFTGAIDRRIGKFEESSGGTLLLDEISEMDIRLQAKLLRAIQEKEIDRVGGSTPIKVDLRVIATSNRDLQAAISQGKFREDLYFRLNIINLQLPPLCDRKEDILDLANHFIEKYSKNNHIPIRELSEEAKIAIVEYNWPGNVRELENTMHRAILLAYNDQITVADLQLDLNRIKYLKIRSLRDVEHEAINDALKYCLGDISNAANILGISITSLTEKIKDFSS
jgi:two-component system response regulator FlrC